MDSPAVPPIKTFSSPLCDLCGSEGVSLHDGLTDQLFGASGTWNLNRCSNPECGLTWLNPMPLADEIHKAYAVYYTHTDGEARAPSSIHGRLRLYAEGYLAARYGYRVAGMSGWRYLLGRLIALHPAARASLDFSVFYLPALSGGQLLEIGCGNGRMLAAMQARGWAVEGVDPDPSAVRQARAKGMEVRLGTLEAQNYPDESFDAIVMSHVIEHVPAPLQLIAECRRLLRSGGKLVVVTPNAGSWGHRHYREHWRGLEPPRHLHIFNAVAMRRLAKNAGFEDFELKTTIRDASGLFLASEEIERKVRGASAPRSWHAVYRVKLMQLLEWVLIKFRPELGEELVLIASKHGYR